MIKYTTNRRAFIWHNGVLGFGIPGTFILWLWFIVTELGWSALWSFPALLALFAALIGGGLIGGGVLGVLLWLVFPDKRD